ncbi:MAG: hypothetical protein BroJett040_24860 [Oligoflexia bacterium]|nr:MAG: hypothetical protein BroJett040_24860 [Oligoflexia bacterium]
MKSFDNILLSLTPKSIRELGGKDLSSSKIFITIALVGIPLIAIFSASYTFAGYTPIAICCWAALGISLLAIPVFYITKKPIFASNFFMTSGLFILVIGGFWAGGIHSPGVLWFSTVQILSIVMFQRRHALTWVAIYCLGALALAQPHLFGLTVTNIISERDFVFFKFIGSLGSAFFMVVIALAGRTQHLLMQKEITRKNEQLTESVGHNTTLVRMLSHDIANLLAIIKFSAEFIGQGKNSPKSLERMNRAIANMTDLIDHVREQQAILSGKKQPQIRETNLVYLVGEAVDLVKEKLSAKNIEIRTIYDKHEKYSAFAEMISTTNVILCNILSNAIKFSEKGSSISIELKNLEDCIQVQITDTGVGMPKAILNNLFHFSSQTTRLGTDGEKGTGFGMPLVKTYMESFGGSIEVKSQSIHDNPQEHGTQVTLLFRKPQADTKSFAS